MEIDKFVVGLLIGSLIAGVAFILTISGMMHEVYLNDETAQDICRELASQSAEFEVSSKDGKLICKYPDFKNTNNIIFKDDAVNLEGRR